MNNAWKVRLVEDVVVVGGTAEQAKSELVKWFTQNPDYFSRVLAVDPEEVVDLRGAVTETEPIEDEQDCGCDECDDDEYCDDEDEDCVCEECGQRI